MAELEHKRIAGRIKDARKEAGITQHQMAELLGVIPRTYQNYESTSNPRIPWDRMSDIERITGKKVEWLLHGDAPDLMEVLEGKTTSTLDDISAKLDQVLERLAVVELSQATEAAAAADSRSQLDELASSLRRSAKKTT